MSIQICTNIDMYECAIMLSKVNTSPHANEQNEAATDSPTPGTASKTQLTNHLTSSSQRAP